MSTWIGKEDDYYWLVTNHDIVDLVSTVLKYHTDHILHISSFDSGPLIPTEEEVAIGWYAKNGVMISPPIDERLDVPYDQYDEWYISGSELLFPNKLEIFVNCRGFHLANPEELTKDDHVTREKKRFDPLLALQERFWVLQKKVGAETYVATGDNTIVVSRDQNFIANVQRSA